MKYIPLSDNDPKNINQMAEQIYTHITETQEITNERISKTPEPEWNERWVKSSNDTQRLNLIAEYLGLYKIGG